MGNLLNLISKRYNVTLSELALMLGFSEEELNNLVSYCSREQYDFFYSLYIDKEVMAQLVSSSDIPIELASRVNSSIDRIRALTASF